MKSLADHITSELGVLIGQPFSKCSRVGNMQMFGFGPQRQKRNRRGELVEVSEINLHIQCRWRFGDGHSILFGRDDLIYPADENVSLEEFDWLDGHSVLDREQIQWFERHRPLLPVVHEVQGDSYGGFRISLAGGYMLECFPCESRRGENSELWRLLGHRADGSHFVITVDGIEQ